MNMLFTTLAVVSGLLASISLEWVAEQGADLANVLYQDWLWSWDQPMPRATPEVFAVGASEDDFNFDLTARLESSVRR
jgi:hypothetical protein